MRKNICLALGHLFTAIGVAGIFLPLLPTTPFLLLAAACYARGSEKFYNWLINHPKLGHFIRDYREKRGIALKTKITALVTLWATISVTAIFFVPVIWVKVLLFAIAAGVTAHIVSFKTL